MEEKKLNIEDWVPIEKIINNGIVKLKNKKYVKIIKINPINFNLKSSFEKKSILNSYKTFLKTCNFDIQILIQSNKENLNNNISIIEKNLKKENKKFLNNIAEDYFEFINKINSLKTSSSKDFYIIISNSEYSNNNSEEFIFEELNEKYFKIKECLLRCGNLVQDINNKKDIKNILFSFFNSRLFFNR